MKTVILLENRGSVSEGSFPAEEVQRRLSALLLSKHITPNKVIRKLLTRKSTRWKVKRSATTKHTPDKSSLKCWNSKAMVSRVVLIAILIPFISCSPRNLENVYDSADSSLSIVSVDSSGNNLHVFLVVSRTRTGSDIFGHNNSDTVLKSELFLATISLDELIKEKRTINFSKIAESRSRIGDPFLVDSKPDRVYIRNNHYGNCSDFVNPCYDSDINQVSKVISSKEFGVTRFLGLDGLEVRMNYVTYLRLEYSDETPVRKVKVEFQLNRRNWDPVEIELLK